KRLRHEHLPYRHDRCGKRAYLPSAWTNGASDYDCCGAGDSGWRASWREIEQSFLGAMAAADIRGRNVHKCVLVDTKSGADLAGLGKLTLVCIALGLLAFVIFALWPGHRSLAISLTLYTPLAAAA